MERTRFARLNGSEPHFRILRFFGVNPCASEFSRAAIVVLIVLLAVLAGRPYLDTLLPATASPRPIAARSDLAESERATIGLFERVSPSVVQVVGVATSSGSAEVEIEGGREQGGTGFVWDGAGHVVTNNHVVSGTRELAIRFATGEVVGASIVGTAPNYDLAVVRLRDTRNLPGPIAVGSSADLKVGQPHSQSAIHSALVVLVANDRRDQRLEAAAADERRTGNRQCHPDRRRR